MSEIPRTRSSDDGEMLRSVLILLFSVAFVVAVVLLGILHAWVGSIFWRWFVMPVFGLGATSVAQMYGLALFIAVFRTSKSARATALDSEWGGGNGGKYFKHLLTTGIVGPLVALLVGWALKSWFL